jgi:hypothetical protein
VASGCFSLLRAGGNAAYESLRTSLLPKYLRVRCEAIAPTDVRPGPEVATGREIGARRLLFV